MKTKKNPAIEQIEKALMPVPLRDARGLFPVPPTASTLHRWTSRGLLLPSGERLRLSSQRVGKRLYTTRHSIGVFLFALNRETQTVNQ